MKVGILWKHYFEPISVQPQGILKLYLTYTGVFYNDFYGLPVLNYGYSHNGTLSIKTSIGYYHISSTWIDKKDYLDCFCDFLAELFNTDVLDISEQP